MQGRPVAEGLWEAECMAVGSEQETCGLSVIHAWVAEFNIPDAQASSAIRACASGTLNAVTVYT